ncbi:MAG: PhzF family phenazine biosynthesis protein [Candidatus Thorarchaeota archaeon]|nr:MAG: PhzF family phenazine biosynthesis protein [Candidatus Thorarchaeota archaeon]
MRAYPYVQTSVFTDSRYSFGGNQLATFWDTAKNLELSDEEMQGMTLEFNFSETTFILPTEQSHCAAKVRIFTPALEIPFAGHPTLGTAFVMKYRGLLPEEIEKTTLELGIGPTPVEYLSGDTILMEQRKPEFLSVLGDKEAIADAIQLDASDILDKNPIQFVSTGHPFLVVEARSLQAVQDAVPSPSRIIEALSDQLSQELVIFSTETVHEDSSVHARMFAPAAGVLEDPATGSAAGPLGAYVEKYDILDRKEIGAPVEIEQGFEIRRPSRLVSEVIGGYRLDGMRVSGQVRLIAEGEFYL